jgi:hypothetical protein
MKHLRILFVVLLLLGCRHAGTRVTAEQLAPLKAGVTTYEEVLRQFGSPTTVTRNMDGTRQVTYSFSRSKPRPQAYIPGVGVVWGMEVSGGGSAVLLFDKNDKLMDYSSTETGMGTPAAVPSPQPKQSTQTPAAE